MRRMRSQRSARTASSTGRRPAAPRTRWWWSRRCCWCCCCSRGRRPARWTSRSARAARQRAVCCCWCRCAGPRRLARGRRRRERGARAPARSGCPSSFGRHRGRAFPGRTVGEEKRGKKKTARGSQSLWKLSPLLSSFFSVVSFLKRFFIFPRFFSPFFRLFFSNKRDSSKRTSIVNSKTPHKRNDSQGDGVFLLLKKKKAKWKRKERGKSGRKRPHQPCPLTSLSSWMSELPFANEIVPSKLDPVDVLVFVSARLFPTRKQPMKRRQKRKKVCTTM